MDSIYHSNIKLILKNNTWVPKKDQTSSVLDQHGLDIKKVLGEGAFAKVKLAYSKKEQKDVAVKIFEKRRLPMDYLKKFLPREIRILNSLNHPHLVSLRDVFETTNRVYVILELAEGGDLLEYINENRHENEAQVKKHFQQLVSGLMAMHEMCIVHRDLKCENVLLDRNNNIKIADFGFARFADIESLLKTICGSFIYTAPELIAGRQEYSGYLTDCWSIGVILYCMLCRKLPFSKDDLMQMANGRGLLQELDFPSHISHDARDVVHGLLDRNPVSRFNCLQTYNHRWVEGYTASIRNEERKEMSSDIISAPSTIANSTRLLNAKSNILFEEVRPNYRNKTFIKAIKRQRVNILAMSAFRKSCSIRRSFSLFTKPSCVLSQSVLAPPKRFRRTANLVTNLLKHKANTGKHRVQKEKNIDKTCSSMSQTNYDDFLAKKQQDIENELRSVKRSQSSHLAKRAMYQKKQLEKNRKELNDHLSKVESDKEKAREKLAKKCVLSCPTK